MAKRPDTSSVSEEDVEALFEQHDLYGADDKSGEDESPDVEEDSTAEEAEEPVEEEAEAKGEDAEDGEEEPEEAEDEESEAETEQNLDWSKADKRLKDAFDAEQARAQKWEKAHSKLQSQLTRESKSRQQEESSLETLRAEAQEARQWNQLLDKHPELQQVLEQAIAKIKDPYADVPDYLKADPLFQQMQRQNQALEQRLARFEQSLEPVKSIQEERTEAKHRERLDGLLNDANAKFKSMFGKDMEQSDKHAVLKYMVDNQYYLNGKNVAIEVFGSQYEQQLQAKRTETLKAKAKKFGTRNKSVSPTRATKLSQDAGSVDEAIARAMADQGYGT
jgi:hypothetical protein